jgi:uncharacterized membrane protein YphA (DoxX/SURF4 family)
MKYIVQICRFIVGIIFIISGFVKAIDPIGFGYKLEEYFAPDVFNIGFLHDLALPQATFFSIFEIVLGAFLLLGIFRKFTTWSLLILIVFFTFLTFYSAYFNKVTDCGCFGDAMKLTPWQSFWKDIFLLVQIIILFIGQKYIQPLMENKKLNYGISAVVLLICGWISYTGIQNLPLIDFRAYAEGKNISEGMKSAQELGLEPPKYQVMYTLKNEKTGEIAEITDEEYLSDSKWYEEGTPWKLDADKTETSKVSNGYEPPVKDFVLDCEGEDKTEFYLNEPKVVFFVIPFTNKLTEDEKAKLNLLYAELTQKGVQVTALVNNDIEGAKFTYCFVDQITLKTMIRNNPGIIVVSKGTVVKKFHDNPIPNSSEILASFH